VVVSFNGVDVDDYHHLQRLAAETEVGRTVKIDIVRDRKPRTVELTVAEAPDSAGPSR
jgi:serine protease Do